MTGDGSIGDFQGGGGDASFGDSVGPGVGSVDAGYFSDAGGGGDTGFADQANSSRSFDVTSSASTTNTALQDFENALAAQDRGMSLAELAAAVQGMTLADKAAVDLSGIGGQREHSPGVAYSDLAALEKAGLGKMDIPGFTQNVEQALAARNVADFMEKAVPALVGLIPNYGIVSTIGRVGSGLLSGTMTPAQALTAGIAGALGARTGIPGPVFEGILSGDFGRAAGAGVQGGLTSLANNLTGSPLGGLALNLSGIGPAVGRSVSEAVSGGTGGSRSGGLGAALGLSSAPSQGSSPTGNTYGDAGINADTYSVLAAIEQAAQEPKQPAWSSQMTAGRYGPLMDYEFGA